MIKLNPDTEFVSMVRSAIKKNGGFCCCSIAKKEETKCPCLAFRQMEKGECHCGLYQKV